MNTTVETSKKLIRGPSMISFINGLEEYPAFHFYRLMKEYGDVVNCPINLYLISDPDMAKSILNRDQKDFNQDDFVSKRVQTVFGLGLVTSQGKIWASQRKLMNPLYNRKAIHEYIPIALEEIDKIMDKWTRYAKENTTFDIVDELADLTIMISGKIQFDTDLKNDLKNIKYYASIGTPYMANGLPFFIPYWIPTPTHIHLRIISRGFNRIFKRIIAQRRGNGNNNNDLTATLINALGDPSASETDKRLMLDEMKTMLIGGYFPVACNLSLFWYVLGQYPEYLKHLYREVENIPFDYKFDPHFYKDFPILTKTLYETMRLLPATFSIWRKSKFDQMVNGVRIPKGKVICLSILNMNRNPKIWESPDEFDPERFNKENIKQRPKHYFMPFGWGNRKCIGDHYAMLVVYLTIIRIIQKFNITIIPNQELELKKAPLMSPKKLYAKVQLK